ncbi:hypothetical protein [Thioalkalivibrio sp. HK1]|uniref:hypothetical protein n=1 Tax=Thioalkalivibrio sp. HK1 TaxID=1469245 RepID=UPI0004710F27|nr:hypothetical protein [Thioalkalivibrio sp. HK1]
MGSIERLQELSEIEKGWLGDGQGERVVELALLQAKELISARADLADLFRIFPTIDGGVSLEFDIDDWSFAVEIMPDGVVEIDGGSEGGEVFEGRSFDGLSKDFFEALDEMVSGAFRDGDSAA